MTTATTPAKPVTADTLPLLIDIHALAKLLDRSVASLERDQAAGVAGCLCLEKRC